MRSTPPSAHGEVPAEKAVTLPVLSCVANWKMKSFAPVVVMAALQAILVVVPDPVQFPSSAELVAMFFISSITPARCVGGPAWETVIVRVPSAVFSNLQMRMTLLPSFVSTIKEYDDAWSPLSVGGASVTKSLRNARIIAFQPGLGLGRLNLYTVPPN